MSNYRVPRSAFVVLAAIVVATSGCTWVALSEDGERVKNLDQSEVEECEQIGRTRSMTKTKLLFIPRNQNKVLTEQTDLARNEAARMEGNAVSAIGEPEKDAQLFGVYKCPSNR